MSQIFGKSKIIVLLVSVGNSSHVALCFREVCANLALTLREIQDV